MKQQNKIFIKKKKNHKIIKTPIQEIVENPIQEVVKIPTNKRREIVEDVIQEVVEEPIQESVEELMQEPLQEVVEEPIQESVEEPVQESVEEPMQEVVEEPMQESELDHISKMLADLFINSIQQLDVKKEEPLKISIIIPVYNTEKYIEKCLNSILKQTYTNIEVITVDDGSTDNSMNIIREFEDDRLFMYNLGTNHGPGFARNFGIGKSTGDYVITIDSDDWLSPDFIEKLVDKAIETNSDIVSGGITIVSSDDYEEICRFLPRTSVGAQKIKDYNNKKIIFLNNKLIRRSMYDQTPYCTWRYCEDTPVVLKLLYYANSVSYADTQGYYYRQHSDSICHNVGQYDIHLFKALCSLDCIEFFSDKGEEYQGVINRQDLVAFLDTIKTQTTPELRKKYCMELAELSGYLLNILVKQK